MKTFIISFLTIAAAFTASAQTFTSCRLLSDGLTVCQKYYANQLLVKARGGDVPTSTKQKLASKYASSSISWKAMSSGRSEMAGYYTLEFSGDVRGIYNAIVSDPNLEWVSYSPVYTVSQAPPTNDPLLSQQWAIWGNLPGNTRWSSSLAERRIERALPVFGDTGACEGHPDFDWGRYFWGINVIDPNSRPTDDHGHGCAVASVVSAKANNSIGIAGVAARARFGAIKMFNSKGESSTALIVAGILAAAQKQVEVRASGRIILNLSFGSNEPNPAIDEAIQVARAAGIIVVAAAGNNGLNLALTKGSPAATEGVITVAASGWDNQFGGGSNWASNFGYFPCPSGRGMCGVLLAAPGMDIDVAVPFFSHGLPFGPLFSPNGYARVDGTSFSAPFVTGAIAHILESFPDISEEEIRIRLMNGNRQMKSIPINSRTYGPRELFISGARLDFISSLIDRQPRPPAPILTMDRVGHSSLKVTLDPQSVVFGSECIREERGVETKTPINLNFEGASQLKILIRGEGSNPLSEDTPYSVSCRVLNATGEWSEWSDWLLTRTDESQSLKLYGSSFSVQPGPIASEVLRFNGKNPILWHRTNVPVLGGDVWYAGLDETHNYKVGVSDSELVLPHIDLRGFKGGVSLEGMQYLQREGLTHYHFDQVEIRVRRVDPFGNVLESIVRENIPNTKLFFQMERFSIDLSEFAGEVIQVSFRFFTNGSSAGIGLLIGDEMVLKYSRH